MIFQRARQLMRLRQFATMGLVLAIMVGMFVVPQLAAHLPVCTQRPAYGSAVPSGVRRRIDVLYDHNLLYCADIPQDIETVPGPVYWGSDGMTSILFFALTGITVTGISDYTFSQVHFPTLPGDAPPYGFRPDWGGEPAQTNQAPDGSPYFYYEAGAPTDSDVSVSLELHGPLRKDQGWRYRDFYRDLTSLGRWISGEASASRQNATVVAPIPITASRWLTVTRRSYNPAFSPDNKAPGSSFWNSIDTLQQPTHLQTASGLLGSTVWVAGVVSGTTPVMVLSAPGAPSTASTPTTASASSKAPAPASVSAPSTLSTPSAPIPEAGAIIEPSDSLVWKRPGSALRLVYFAFPLQPAGTTLEARYWNNAKERSGRPPDYTWPVTFP